MVEDRLDDASRLALRRRQARLRGAHRRLRPMFEFEATIFRFANVVGPQQTHGVGYDFVRRLLADPRRLEILGDGTQTKSYLYIDNVIDAITRFLDRPTPGVEVYNVATGDYITVTEIARLAVELLGLRGRRVHL